MATRDADRLLAPQRAYQWLHETIITTPREEELFLTEAEIAEKSGLSRTPVREALLRLESEGFIRRIPHKGAYVPAVTDRDVADIMEARLMIEERAVAKVAASGRGGDLGLAELIEQQAVELDPVRFIELDLRFHTAIMDAAGNGVLVDFYRSLRDRQTRMGIRAVTVREQRHLQVITEHRAIADALAAGDPAAAVAAIRTHLNTTLASMTDPEAQRRHQP